MKAALISVFVAITLTSVCAQSTTRLDSLKRAYSSAKQDTLKILAQIEIALELGKNNPDTIIVLVEKVKKLSEKIGFQKGVGRVLNAFGTAWLAKGNYESALASYIQAGSVLLKVNDRQGVASSLNGQGSIYKNQGAFDLALDRYGKSLNIYTEIGDKQGIAMNLNSIGVVHDYRGDYSLSIDYYNKSIRLYKELGDETGEAICLGNIGVIHQNQGEYNKALECYKRSLELYERERDQHGIALVFNNMGIVYYYQSNYPLALEFYQKGLKMYEAIDNSRGMALILGNIGIIHQDESEYDKALEHHIKSKSMFEKLHDRDGVATSLTNIANAYLGKREHPLALEHYKASLHLSREIKSKFREAVNLTEMAKFFTEINDYKNASLYYHSSLKIMEELQDRQGQAAAWDGLAKIELKSKNYGRCIAYARQGLAIAREINALYDISLLSQTLYQAYKQTNDYERALQYHELHKNAADSLFDIKKEKALANLEATADLELKEREIILLNKNQEILEAGRLFQQRIIYVVSLALFLVLVLAYFLYNSRQNERMAKEIISQQKEEVLRQKEVIQQINSELQKQNEQLAEANATKNKLFSIIGHDLRSPIGSLEGILSLTNRGSISQQQFQAILPKLHRNVQTVQITLDNLLHWSISQMSGAKVSSTHLPISHLVNEQIELFAEVSKAKSIEVVSIVDPELMAWADKNHVRLVLRNLLNNALKFTHPGGKVRIEAKRDKDHVVISIEDNGVGMTLEQIDGLFRRRPGNQTKGTTGEPGTGLGLQLCMDVLLLNNGEIRVSSEPTKGSTFFLYLPIAEQT